MKSDYTKTCEVLGIINTCFELLNLERGVA